MKKRLLGAILSTAVTASLFAMAAPPAGADGNNNGNTFSVADPAGDAEFSTLCTFDDRSPDPYTGIGGTGVQAANCDNKIGETDIQSYSFSFVPPTSSDALLNPAGNDGTWGTSDDGAGPDGDPGTSDDPVITARTGTLKATWTFAKPWPAPNTPGFYTATGSKNNETVSGFTMYARFRNADLENNRLQPGCDRNNSTPASPKYIFDPKNAYHYEDGTNLFLIAGWEFNGPGNGSRVDQQFWRPRVGIGYYDPNIDADINLVNDPMDNVLYNPNNTGAAGANPWTGLGKYYDFQMSADRKTITVKMPGVYVDTSSSCLVRGNSNNKASFYFDPYARTAADKNGALAPRSAITGQILRPGNNADDRLFDLYTSVGVGVKPQLPVPIPTGSLVCATLCPIWEASVPRVSDPVIGSCLTCYPLTDSDISWVIGLSFTADQLNLADGSNGFQGGILGTPPSLGPSVMPGPTCNNPTFGGLLPSSPLYSPGNPCALRNPVSVGLKHNTYHIHVI